MEEVAAVEEVASVVSTPVCSVLGGGASRGAARGRFGRRGRRRRGGRRRGAVVGAAVVGAAVVGAAVVGAAVVGAAGTVVEPSPGVAGAVRVAGSRVSADTPAAALTSGSAGPATLPATRAPSTSTTALRELHLLIGLLAYQPHHLRGVAKR